MKLQHVCVLGAGTMGAGIAQWFAQSGVTTQLADQNSSALEKSQTTIHGSWDKLLQKGKFTSEQVDAFKKNLSIGDVSSFHKEADLVIEAIVENIDIKVSVFQNLDQHFSDQTIFATNTSSIPVDAMAKELSPERRERFLGLHFFNPAPIMKLVEVVRGHFSSPELISSLSHWFNEQGKKAAECKDGPGFIVNRLARNFYGEPFRILKHENKEGIKEVDRVLKEVGGFRMGPFELMDLIGIDVNYEVSKSVWTSFYYEARFAPHAIQRSLVQSGRLGRKSGEGFYSYE